MSTPAEHESYTWGTWHGTSLDMRDQDTSTQAQEITTQGDDEFLAELENELAIVCENPYGVSKPATKPVKSTTHKTPKGSSKPSKVAKSSARKAPKGLSKSSRDAVAAMREANAQALGR
jgi:hypothetical protein